MGPKWDQNGDKGGQRGTDWDKIRDKMGLK